MHLEGGPPCLSMRVAPGTSLITKWTVIKSIYYSLPWSASRQGIVFECISDPTAIHYDGKTSVNNEGDYLKLKEETVQLILFILYMK